MSSKTSIPNLAFTNVSIPTAPKITVASDSLKGSGAVTLDNGVTMTEGGSKPTLEMLLTFKNTEGKYMQATVPATGFTSTTVIAGMKRGIEQSGIDLETENSDLDIDLLEGSELVGAIPAQLWQLVFDALRAQIGCAIKFNASTTFRDTGILADRVFADDTARDAAITSPSNGMSCYNTGDGVAQDYIGGSWIDREAGGTFPNTSITVAGKSETATSIESQTAASDTGGTGANIFILPTDIAANVQNSKHNYIADAGSDDTYVITIVPAIAAYADGQVFYFQANTANTGAATLNVNGKGAKTIKKFDDQDLEDGDIEEDGKVQVIYDSGDDTFKMLSPVATQMSTADSATLTDGGEGGALHEHSTQEITRKHDALSFAVSATSDTEVIAHGLGGTPNWVRLFCTMDEPTAVSGAAQNIVSMGMSDGAGDDSSSWTGSQDSAGNMVGIAGSSSTKSIYLAFRDSTTSETIQGVATFNGTNLTLTFTNSDAAAKNIHVQWEVGF